MISLNRPRPSPPSSPLLTSVEFRPTFPRLFRDWQSSKTVAAALPSSRSLAPLIARCSRKRDMRLFARPTHSKTHARTRARTHARMRPANRTRTHAPRSTPIRVFVCSSRKYETSTRSNARPDSRDSRRGWVHRALNNAPICTEIRELYVSRVSSLSPSSGLSSYAWRTHKYTQRVDKRPRDGNIYRGA